MQKYLVCVLVLSISGCAVHTKTSVDAKENDERHIISTEYEDGVVATCLEPIGSIVSNTGIKIDIGASKEGVGEAKVNFEMSGEVSKIYEISEIMQLGHTAFYRLCEARMNGFISNVDYKASFSDTFFQINTLIQSRLDFSHKEAITKLEMEKLKKEEVKELQKEVKRLNVAVDGLEGADLSKAISDSTKGFAAKYPLAWSDISNSYADENGYALGAVPELGEDGNIIITPEGSLNFLTTLNKELEM